MTQFLEPNSTASNTGFALTGAATAHECVDETIAATDGDTTRLQTLTQGHLVKLGLQTGYAPSDLTLHKVKVNMRFGGANTANSVLVELLEGSTVIASTSHVISAGYTTYTLSLSSTEAGNITDYSNLFVQITLSTWTGGSARISTVEFEMASARAITAAVGSFTLTGNNAGLSLAFAPMAAAVGTFTLTGQAATLTYASGTTAYTLTADTVAFVLTGNDAALPISHALAADLGTFTLTGNDAGLSSARVCAVDVGSFALTGLDAGLSSTRTLSVDVGVFTLIGGDAALLLPGSMAADPGVFTLTGFDSGLTSARSIPASTGAFVLTGQAAGISPGRSIAAGVGSFALTGNAAGLQRLIAVSLSYGQRGHIALAGSEAGDSPVAGSARGA